MTASRFSLARRLRAGETVYCGWCAIPAPLVAETVAREGFAAVNIDQQHGLYDTAISAQAIAAIHHAAAAPMVRVPLGDFASASRMLDYGAEAIIAPMINNLADAKRFVAATKYPPLGERSFGPTRAAALAGIDVQDYFRTANTETLALAMIETREALNNVETIAGTDGVDGLFVGPFDLSVALSDGAVLDPLSKDVEMALDVILGAAKKAGKFAGLYCSNAERALEGHKRGFRLLAVGSDTSFLRAGAAAQLAKLKS
jgi:4-hydroxy-2-oxoheptanedioate aldolase